MANELRTATVERLRALNAGLNAITDFYDDAPPATDGPFMGVPFVIKQLMADCAGKVTTVGSKFFAVQPVAASDSAAVARMRKAGLADIPVGAFAALVSSIGVALTLPVGLGTVAYLWVDFVNARVAFGGADLFDSWLGWLMREPQTLVLAAPALGILADAAVRTAKSRQPLRGAVLVGVGVAATVVFSSVTQQVHVFEVGKTPFETVQSFVPFALFNLLPLLAPLVAGLTVLGGAVYLGVLRLLAPGDLRALLGAVRRG